jgi:hypothetical protein
MGDFTTAAFLAALALKITSLLKYLSAGQFRQAGTTVVPWVGAFLVLLMGAQADATAHIMLPGLTTELGSVDIMSLLLASTALGAAGSVVYDVKSAIDASDTTSKEPPLGG